MNDMDVNANLTAIREIRKIRGRKELQTPESHNV